MSPSLFFGLIVCLVFGGSTFAYAENFCGIEVGSDRIIHVKRLPKPYSFHSWTKRYKTPWVVRKCSRDGVVIGLASLVLNNGEILETWATIY